MGFGIFKKVDLEKRDLNGFFRVSVRTLRRKIVGLIVFILAVCAIGFGIYTWVLKDWRESKSLCYIVCGLIAVPFSLVYLIEKLGIKFEGVCINNSGISIGKLVVYKNIIKTNRKLMKSLTGEAFEGKWREYGLIPDKLIRLHVVLRESSGRNKFYFSEINVITNTISYPLTISEDSINDLTAMCNGTFSLLGNKRSFDYHEMLNPLKRVANVIELLDRKKHSSECLLSIRSKHSKEIGSISSFSRITYLVYKYGAIGGAMGSTMAAIDGVRKGIAEKGQGSFKKRLMNGTLFDEEFTKQLNDFLDEHGWELYLED